jgi:aspartate racemase
MSWHSGIEYERQINQQVNVALGGTSSANLIIRSFNFQEIAALQAEERWAELADILVLAASGLVAAGAEAIAICTNTMHFLAPELESELNVPLLHIGDATAEAILATDARKVALLGTRFTMEKDFLSTRIEAAGVSVTVPHADARTRVHQIIYDELVQGHFTDASRNEVLGIMRQMVDEGATGIIAGCTEIELLVPEDLVRNQLGVEYFATARIHAAAIARYALGE